MHFEWNRTFNLYIIIQNIFTYKIKLLIYYKTILKVIYTWSEI